MSFAAVPSVPSGVTARVGTTSAYGAGTVTVSWTKVSGATAYAARLTKISDNAETILSVTGETNNEVVFNGLSGGSTYVVQVRAFQVTDASEWSSNTLSVVPKTAPRAPNKPTVVAGVGKATVSWTAVSASDNGGLDITSYVIKEINTALSNTAAADAISYEFTGLTAGASAEFTVTAINSANTTGTTSVKSDAVTIPSTATLMSAPTIAGTGTAGEARVSWLPPTSNGGSSLLSFTVKLIKDGVDLVSRVVSDITETFSTFTSLATGTYTSKVTSTNGVGTSAFSTESGSLNVTAAVIATVAPSASATPSATATTPSGEAQAAVGVDLVVAVAVAVVPQRIQQLLQHLLRLLRHHRLRHRQHRQPRPHQNHRQAQHRHLLRPHLWLQLHLNHQLRAPELQRMQKAKLQRQPHLPFLQRFQVQSNR